MTTGNFRSFFMRLATRSTPAFSWHRWAPHTPISAYPIRSRSTSSRIKRSTAIPTTWSRALPISAFLSSTTCMLSRSDTSSTPAGVMSNTRSRGLRCTECRLVTSFPIPGAAIPGRRLLTYQFVSSNLVRYESSQLKIVWKRTSDGPIRFVLRFNLTFFFDSLHTRYLFSFLSTEQTH